MDRLNCARGKQYTRNGFCIPNRSQGQTIATNRGGSRSSRSQTDSIEPQPPRVHCRSADDFEESLQTKCESVPVPMSRISHLVLVWDCSFFDQTRGHNRGTSDISSLCSCSSAIERAAKTKDCMRDSNAQFKLAMKCWLHILVIINIFREVILCTKGNLDSIPELIKHDPGITPLDLWCAI